MLFISGIAFTLTIIYALYEIPMEDNYWYAQKLEELYQFLPKLAVQLLDTELTGSGRGTALLMLLSSVFLMSFSLISACVKSASKSDKTSVASLKRKLAFHRRQMRQQKNQLKQLRSELRQMKANVLVKESQLLHQVHSEQDNLLANRMKDGEILLLKERLSDTSQRLAEEAEKYEDLKTTKKMLQKKLKKIKRTQENDTRMFKYRMSDKVSRFQSDRFGMSKRHEAELMFYEERQCELEDEQEMLETEIFTLEEKLRESTEENSRFQMNQRIQSVERDYRNRMCTYRTKEYKQWMAMRATERKFSAKQREGSKYRQMLTELHQKVELGQVEKYLAQRKRRHVYFHHVPEVFIFSKDEPACGDTAGLPLPPDYWSDVVQSPVLQSSQESD